jgi:glucokinase
MNQEKPVHLQDLPMVVAVDLGGTQIRTAVLRGATLLSRVGLLTGENPTPDRVIPRVYDAVEQALAQAGIALDQVAGIGIAAPGPLDSRTGIVYAPPNLPGWDYVPLRDMFYERFKIPIFVENDANAAGLGEYMFGAGRGCSDIVYLTLSTGIGGGVIIDGKIIDGASGTAGELGHMTIDRHGGRCNCGNIGCLEYIASGTAIARRANEAIAAGQGAALLGFARTLLEHPGAAPASAGPSMHESAALEDDEMGKSEDVTDEATGHTLYINARTVAMAAEAGVPLAKAIITDAAEAIGVGLVNIIHIFNPEMIILGGGVTQMGPLLMEPALRIVKARAMKAPRDAVRVVQAQLGPEVGLVGAGALIYYNKWGAHITA